jgi:TM2 domain-containing membrane protein YozV
VRVVGKPPGLWWLTATMSGADWVRVAAVAGHAAALLTAVAVPALFPRAWPYGLLLCGAALLQAWAAHRIMLSATARAVITGIYTNFGLVGLYFLGHTVGLPFAPPRTLGTANAHVADGHAGVTGAASVGVPVFPRPTTVTRVEPITALDVAMSTCAFLSLAVLVTCLPGPARRRTVNTLAAVGMATWLSAWLVGLR